MIRQYFLYRSKLQLNLIKPFCKTHKLYYLPFCVSLWICGTFFMQPSRFVQYSARAVDLSLGTEESLMALKTTKVASHHWETDRQTGETKKGTSN